VIFVRNYPGWPHILMGDLSVYTYLLDHKLECDGESIDTYL